MTKFLLRTIMFFFILITCTSSNINIYALDVLKENKTSENFQIVEHSWGHNESDLFYNESKLDKKRKEKNNNRTISYNSYKSSGVRNRNRSNPVAQKSRITRRHKRKAYLFYKIKRGDTLFSISKKFNIDQKKLCKINRIYNKNKIKKGSILKIPKLQRFPVKLKNKKSVIAGEKIKKSQKKIFYKPDFTWPLKNIKTYTHDGINGVKPIGIIITGKQNAGVTTSASGIVKKIGYMRGFGNYIIIKHKGRFATVYSNLKKIVVKEGEEVKVGTMIGYVGNNNKLHFQIDYEGRPDDPLKYLPKNS